MRKITRSAIFLIGIIITLTTLAFTQHGELLPFDNFRYLRYCEELEKIENKDSLQFAPHFRILNEISERMWLTEYPPPEIDFYNSLQQITNNISGNWVSLGPEGGWIRTLVMDPNDHNILYAQTYNYPAQIFKSIDGGSTWEMVSSITSYINCMVIDPTNSSIFYAGMGGYIYKSVDGGITWNRYRFDYSFWPYIYDISVCPTNSNLVYIGGDYYNQSDKYLMVVYKSTNGGLNWTRYDVSPASYDRAYTYCFAVNPKNPNELYIGGESYEGSSWHGEFFKSNDGGNNWIDIYVGISGYVNAIVIDPTSPNKVYAGTSSGIYRSNDSGLNWTKNNGWAYSYELAINPQNTNIIYSGYYDGIYKSIDGGKNWTYHRNGLNGTCYSLLVDHTAGENIFYGSVIGVFKSSNSGVAWSAANSGLIASSITTMGMAPSDPKTIYIEFDNNAVFKTTNYGDNWIRLPEFLACGNIGAIAVDPISPDIAYALEGSG